mgnify:CR=1 FL=1
MNLNAFLVLTLSLSLYAQNLDEIMQALHQSKKVLSLESQASAKTEENSLFNTYEAPEIELGVVHAESTVESHRWTEYAVGVSQRLEHPFSSKSKNNVVSMLNASVKQNLKHDIHVLELQTTSKYYSACMAKELNAKATILFSNQNKRLEQMYAAYKLGEVSKKDYLFYKLDILGLQKDVSRYQRAYLVELSNLEKHLDNTLVRDVECKDLVEPKRELQFNELQDHGEVKELAYQLQAANSMQSISDTNIDALGYSFGYEKEYDVDRYVFGVSMPLSFASSQKEKIQAKNLYTSTSLNESKEALHTSLQAKRKSSSLRLATYFDEYALLENEIVPLSEELVKLAEFAYISGEGSVLESITAARGYQENLLDMLKMKKEYYKEFFDLHIIADLDFGERNE